MNRTVPMIALATCRSLRPEEHDDDALRAAFATRPCTVVEPAWDDADVDWHEIDATLIRTTWDYTERWDEYAEWVDRVAAVGTLLNPAPVVRWNLDKRYLRELEAHGVPVVPTHWIEGERDLDPTAWRETIAAWRTDRLLVKPSVGATASGTLRVDADRPGLDAALAHAHALLRSGVAVLVQPYLADVETVGERSAIVIDGVVTHGVEKRPVPGDYRVQDDWGGRDAPHELDDRERRLVAATLAAAANCLVTAAPIATLPLTYARVDWLLDGNGAPRLVELELIEPSLFFRHSPHAAAALADAVLDRAAQRRPPSPNSSPSPPPEFGPSDPPPRISMNSPRRPLPR